MSETSRFAERRDRYAAGQAPLPRGPEGFADKGHAQPDVSGDHRTSRYLGADRPVEAAEGVDPRTPPRSRGFGSYGRPERVEPTARRQPLGEDGFQASPRRPGPVVLGHPDYSTEASVEATARDRGGTPGEGAPRYDRASSRQPYDDYYERRAPEPHYYGEESPNEDVYGEEPPVYRGGHARELAYSEGDTYGEDLSSGRQPTAADYENAYREYEDEAEERSGRGFGGGPLVLIGALVVVALVAGGLVYWFATGGGTVASGDPPVVSAPADPAKLQPSDPVGEPVVPRQTKLIYDRLLSDEEREQERLVPREEQPLMPGIDQGGAMPGAVGPADDGLPVPLPPPPPGGGQSSLPVDTIDRQTVTVAGAGIRGNAETITLVTTPRSDQLSDTRASMDATDTPAPIESVATDDDREELTGASQRESAEVEDGAPPPRPRQKPVELAAAAAEAPAPANVRNRPEAAGSGPLQIAALPGTTTSGQATETGPISIAPRSPTDPPRTAPPAGVPRTNITTSRDVGIDPDRPAQPRTSAPQTLPSVLPPAPEPREREQTASLPPASPQAQTTQQPSPFSSGDYMIQLASFRNPSDATAEFQRLRATYPSLLGEYRSHVEEADLGDRGKFYRLRVGPLASRERAASLCRSLISAGEKDCLVRRN